MSNTSRRCGNITVDGVATNDNPHRRTLDTIVGPDGHEYMRRHHFDDHTRIHEILHDDPGRDLHDHPWDYTTTILQGSYREHTRTGHTDHHPGDILRRRELLDGPVVT